MTFHARFDMLKANRWQSAISKMTGGSHTRYEHQTYRHIVKERTSHEAHRFEGHDHSHTEVGATEQGRQTCHHRDHRGGTCRRNRSDGGILVFRLGRTLHGGRPVQAKGSCGERCRGGVITVVRLRKRGEVPCQAEERQLLPRFVADGVAGRRAGSERRYAVATATGAGQ